MKFTIWSQTTKQQQLEILVKNPKKVFNFYKTYLTFPKEMVDGITFPNMTLKQRKYLKEVFFKYPMKMYVNSYQNGKTRIVFYSYVSKKELEKLNGRSYVILDSLSTHQLRTTPEQPESPELTYQQ